MVAGDSAGGNLAAVVALLARESMRWFWDKYLASPAAGHMPHLEQLERVSSLIDAFLAE